MGSLHRWANAPNKATHCPTDANPRDHADRYATKWDKEWTTSQPNPLANGDRAIPTDHECFLMLAALRKEILDSTNSTQRLQYIVDQRTAPN